MPAVLSDTTLSCCVCGATEAVSWRTAADNLLGGSETWRAVRCARCGTRRLDPRPAPETMGRFYAPDTYARAEAPGSEIGKRLDTLAEHLAERGSRLAPAPGDLIDVGCGDGRFLLAMQQRGWRVTGSETDPVAADLARRRTGATILEEPLEAMSLPEASYDLVSLLHVLEHVPDPRATLTICHRLLRPGGALLLDLPNAGSPEASLFGANWYHLDLPRHLWGFTPQSLVRLTEEIGFTVESVRQYPLLFSPQSARNALAHLRHGRQSGNSRASAPAGPARGSGGRLQTTVFLRLLDLSERMAAARMPGEILELIARRPA